MKSWTNPLPGAVGAGLGWASTVRGLERREPGRTPAATARDRIIAPIVGRVRVAPCGEEGPRSMFSRSPAHGSRQAPTPVALDPTPSTNAVEFVRFCYRRRHVGWPELYDEMCAVAGRNLFRGWGADELNEEGIGFSLFEMPALAALVHTVVADEQRTLSPPVLMEVDGEQANESAAPPTQPIALPAGA